MPARTTLILLLLVAAAHAAYAQTGDDFQIKYGKSADVYSVSEHIWMTPEYTVDGQVCRMRLYSKRIDAKTNFGSTKLLFVELRDVLNDLVPLGTRGNKKQGFGISDLGGGTVWTNYDYENVHFTFVSFFRLTRNPKLLKTEEFLLLDSDVETTPELAENLTPDKNDFANSDSIEFVTVSWTAIKCVKQ